MPFPSTPAQAVQNLQAILGTQLAALRLCTLAARYANETGCDVSLWGYKGIPLYHCNDPTRYTAVDALNNQLVEVR